jgi:hypothetical protein
MKASRHYLVIYKCSNAAVNEEPLFRGFLWGFDSALFLVGEGIHTLTLRTYIIRMVHIKNIQMR